MCTKKTFLLSFLIALSFSFASAQSFQFAHVSDTHVGSSTGADDLRRTVADINANPKLDFVIISGDITEFGADEELVLAKEILSAIRIPWYIIPGNHDSNWSESGGNTFQRVFGNEKFAFEHKGYLFVGTACGPNMRMGPGQIPREHLVWMDSLFNARKNVDQPLIFVNHYPQDSSLNNWFEAIDRLKTRNIQLILCGHGHQNKQYNFEGIPAVMGRSNLRAKDSIGGYNIVTIDGKQAIYQERKPALSTAEPWATVSLSNHGLSVEKGRYHRPDYSVNKKFPQVDVQWTVQDASDIGAGFAKSGKFIITANTSGEVYALQNETGQRVWTFKAAGKIYSTPAVWKDYVVVGSADNFIYCLQANTGKLAWKFKAEKAVLGSPLIHQGVAYIGASDGQFRAFDIKSGKLLWSFNKVQGYISAKPLYYEHTLYFGSWKNGFYALDPNNGELKWQWSNGAANRMYSAAACYPVGAKGRIFLVAPDRYMTALDAKTGETIWRKKVDSMRVRESMGLARDGKSVYVKTMDGNVLGISTSADSMKVVWKAELQLPYELAPTAIVTQKNLVLVPSHSGLLSAINNKTGKTIWQYKISNGLINPILPLGKKQVIASTMDGKIVKLNY